MREIKKMCRRIGIEIGLGIGIGMGIGMGPIGNTNAEF
jgi:hypothetical protein